VAAGLIIAGVIGAQAKTTFKKMVKGTPATAADVNAAHQDLATAIDKVQAAVTALKGGQACPPGYTHDTTATAITLCRRGKDEMVKAGAFWVDRYEISVVDTALYNSGSCNGKGSHYGVPGDNYPATFPDSGNHTAPLYACSVKGAKPSASMTWFQAASACALAGKRICSNHEWQTAALGTPDDSTSCNTFTSLREAAGARAKCASYWGAQDMVGNVWELTADWVQAGRTTGSYTSGAVATPWPSGYGDGKDGTWNINGQAESFGGVATGIPAALSRGGGSKTGTNAGVFTISMYLSPAYRATSTGARCCR